MLTSAQYSPIVKEVWSTEFFGELRPQLGVSQLISSTFSSQIMQWGNKIKVPTMATQGRAQILTSDNEAYTVQAPLISNTELTIDKSAVYAVDVTDWAKYQANPAYQDEIKKILAHEIARAIDTEVLNNIAAASSASGQTAMTKALFAQASRVLGINDVPNDGTRVALIDEYYLESLLQVNEALSRDYTSTSSAFLTGKIKDPIYGFQIYVTNLLPAKTAYFFHPSFMQIAIQKGAEYKELDLEVKTNVPSTRIRALNLFGLKQFDNKRVYKIYNT